jgi:uncharacterized membrane protein (UPF0127 family)
VHFLVRDEWQAVAMTRSIAFLLAAGLVFGACSEPSTTSQPSPSQSPTVEALPSDAPTFDPARILIDTDKGSVIVDAEVAASQEQWAYGLMNRTSLPEDAGMVFLFFQLVNAEFYMKDTLIPLSIAFFDDDGKILDIQDMDPCDEEPCERFSPGEPYSGALEVNQGAFGRWGVKVGDRITVTH